MKPARNDFGIYNPLPPNGRMSETEVPMVATGGDDPLADTVGVSTNVRSSIRILVIDDDRTLREGCASLLQVEGYTVTVSGRGDEAIEMIRRNPFDIVLTVVTALIGIVLLAAGCAGYALRPVGPINRVVLFLAGLCLIPSPLDGPLWLATNVAGLAAGIGVMLWQYRGTVRPVTP